MQYRFRIPLVLSSVLLLIPSIAYANAGSVMILAGAAQLLIGNGVIGVVEGLLIAWVFKVERATAIWIMIVANYFSGVVGYVALSCIGLSSANFPTPGYKPLADATIYDVGSVLLRLLLISYAATTLLEWPFCFRLLRNTKHRLRRSILASVMAQTTSYMLMILFAYTFSNVTVITRLDRVKDLSFASGSRAIVYYISDADDCIYSVRPDGSARKKVAASPKVTGAEFLQLAQSRTPGQWDICVQKKDGDNTIVIPSAGYLSHRIETDPKVWPSPPGMRPLDLSPTDQHDWDVRICEFTTMGISAVNTRTGLQVEIALLTPFQMWLSRNVNILPSGLLVYQLERQIVVVDLNKRKIGLLAMGRGPVAVLEDGDERRIIGRIH